MTTRTKLVILELLARMFDLIWVGASITFVYFLYGALANDGPWAYLSWPFAVGFIAKQIAAALKDTRHWVDYVDQLTDRGYEREDAEAAWRIATGGGANLLRNLQQAEIADEIARLESAIGTASLENQGD
jgi:phosphoglucomutase